MATKHVVVESNTEFLKPSVLRRVHDGLLPRCLDGCLYVHEVSRLGLITGVVTLRPRPRGGGTPHASLPVEVVCVILLGKTADIIVLKTTE